MKSDLIHILREYLDDMRDQVLPWTYEMVVIHYYKKGLAPLSRNEFTYWMWEYNDRMRMFGKEIHKEQIVYSDGIKVTCYEWDLRRDGDAPESDIHAAETLRNGDNTVICLSDGRIAFCTRE